MIRHQLKYPEMLLLLLGIIIVRNGLVACPRGKKSSVFSGLFAATALRMRSLQSRYFKQKVRMPLNTPS